MHASCTLHVRMYEVMSGLQRSAAAQSIEGFRWAERQRERESLGSVSLLHQFTSCRHAVCTLHALTVHAACTHCARCTHAWCTLHARIVHTARTNSASCTHAPTVHTSRTHCAHCTHAPTVHAARTHCARCAHASCTLHVPVFAIWEAFKVCGVPDPQDPMFSQVVAWEEAGCCVLGPRKKRVQANESEVSLCLPNLLLHVNLQSTVERPSHYTQTLG